MIELSVWLYGKPSWDMEIEGKRWIDPLMISNHGKLLQERLERVAEVIEKLQKEGWQLAEAYGAVYSLTFYKNLNKREAEQEVQGMGIELSEINLEQVEM